MKKKLTFVVLLLVTIAAHADSIQVKYQIKFNDQSNALPTGTTLWGTSAFDMYITGFGDFLTEYLYPFINVNGLRLHDTFTEIVRYAVPPGCGMSYPWLDSPYLICELWLGANPQTDFGGSAFEGAAALGYAGSSTLPDGTRLPTTFGEPTTDYVTPDSFSYLYYGPFCQNDTALVPVWSCTEGGGPLIAYLGSASNIGPYTDPVQVGTWSASAKVTPVSEPPTALLLTCGLAVIATVRLRASRRGAYKS